MIQGQGVIGVKVEKPTLTRKDYAEELRFVCESLEEVRVEVLRMRNRNRLAEIVGDPASVTTTANHMESLGKLLISIGDIVKGWA